MTYQGGPARPVQVPERTRIMVDVPTEPATGNPLLRNNLEVAQAFGSVTASSVLT